MLFRLPPRSYFREPISLTIVLSKILSNINSQLNVMLCIFLFRSTVQSFYAPVKSNPNLFLSFISRYPILSFFESLWCHFLVGAVLSSFNIPLGFPGESAGKESACNAEDPGSIPGSGSPPGEGNSYPLQYSCLENSMDRGAWWVQSMGSQRVWHDWVDNSFLAPRFLFCVPKWRGGRLGPALWWDLPTAGTSVFQFLQPSCLNLAAEVSGETYWSEGKEKQHFFPLLSILTIEHCYIFLDDVLVLFFLPNFKESVLDGTVLYLPGDCHTVFFLPCFSFF